MAAVDVHGADNVAGAIDETPFGIQQGGEDSRRARKQNTRRKDFEQDGRGVLLFGGQPRSDQPDQLRRKQRDEHTQTRQDGSEQSAGACEDSQPLVYRPQHQHWHKRHQQRVDDDGIQRVREAGSYHQRIGARMCSEQVGGDGNAAETCNIAGQYSRADYQAASHQSAAAQSRDRSGNRGCQAKYGFSSR